MAKCIAKKVHGKETAQRVDNDAAKELVANHGWRYIPKHMMNYYDSQTSDQKAGKNG